MGKSLEPEALFAHLRCDGIIRNHFSTLPIATVDTHLQSVCAMAVGKGEKAECVYLNDSIITHSNKHSTLGGYRFVISNPNIFTQCLLKGYFAKFERKNYPALKF